jgi:hypothetical protein
MTTEEPKTPPTLNEELIRQMRLYIPCFSRALKVALAEHDQAQLKVLEGIAQRNYRNLSAYIDECDPAIDLDPTVLVLVDYFRENSEEIFLARMRKLEGEEWKDATG